MGYKIIRGWCFDGVETLFDISRVSWFEISMFEKFKWNYRVREGTFDNPNNSQVEHEIKHDLHVTKNENYNTNGKNCSYQWRNYSSRVHNFSLTEPTIFLLLLSCMYRCQFSFSFRNIRG